MTLTMIQLEPDMARLVRWANTRRLLAPRGEDDLGYALHALLAATFGDLAPKPFVLRQEPCRPLKLLGYASFPGDVLRRHAAATAEPDAAEAIGLEKTFASKTMPEAWDAGRRLGFALQTRPMVRTDREGNRARTKEVDCFVLSPPNSNRGDVYADWLRGHLAGADLEHVALDAFRLSRVRRRNAGRTLKDQKGPEASFSGILRISDSAAFAATLARGVGRHRAFGFGMLLLRPLRGAGPC